MYCYDKLEIPVNLYDYAVNINRKHILFLTSLIVEVLNLSHKAMCGTKMYYISLGRLQEMTVAPSFDLFYGNDIKIKIDAQGNKLTSGMYISVNLL